MKEFNFKKTVLFLSLVFLFTAFAVFSVSAATSGMFENGFMWNLDSDGTLTITGNGDMPNWISYDFVPWYSINGLIKKIVISQGVTSIGDYAFSNCKSLTSIEIHDSVTSIGDSAFEDCESLTSIEIPDSVTSIGKYAFYNCTSLISIEIPDSVTSIGGATFANTAYYNDSGNWENAVLYIGNHLIKAKSSISSAYTIKDGTKNIADSAFGDCESLESIEIPDSVTSIGEYAFSKRTSLTSVTFGENSQLTSIGEYAFYYCTSLTSIEIPDSVTSIGEYAFEDCESLTSITLPTSITTTHKAYIGSFVLESISLPFIGSSRTVTGADDAVFGYIFGPSKSGEYYTAKQHYSSSGSYTYKIPTSLKEVYVTDATQIPYGAFDGCLGIEYIELNEGITQISQYAFANCDFLSVRIPSTVTRIGSNAFSGTDVEKLYVSLNSYGHQYAIDNGYPYEIYDYFPVSGITLTKTAYTMNENDTYKLTAAFTPENATNKNIIWTSNNETVASVSSNGTVTAIRKGEAIITATTEEGGYTASCKITILRPVTSVTLNHDNLFIGVGNTKTLTATVNPSGASDDSVTWKSSDPSVATVVNGIVTAVDYGTAVITVTTNDGEFTDTCTVSTTVAVTGISMNKTSANLDVGEAISLSTVITPANAYDKSVVWSTSDSSVATVSASGIVTAVGLGNAVITATTNDGGYKATCTITVTEEDQPADPTAPYVELSEIKCSAGNTVTLDVVLNNNPGFVSLGLEIDYDSTYLTLTGVSANTSVGATFTPAPNYSKMPYNFGWSSTNNVSFEGRLVTLTFEVSEDAPDGEYPVSLSYYRGLNGNYTDGFDVNYDENFDAMGLNYISGGITVTSYIPGDANGDGNVTDRDATYLLRYLAGWTIADIVEESLDVDGSGSITDRDATILLRYLAGWEIELK